jgi:hypothetical protein
LHVPFFMVMDIIIIMSLCIWMAQNNIIFQALQPALGQKRFVLAAKTGFCWRARHPPATLSQ